MATSSYGIIGWPLTHTFSPGYFTEKFLKENIAATYRPFPLDNIDHLPELLRQQPDLSGFNVTIPYKTAIIPYLYAMSDDARGMGAVNCVAIKDGKLTGHNTDWLGFRNSLQPLLRPNHKQALILGNGGAAKAVAYTLGKLHIPFRIVARGHDSNTIPYKAVTAELLADYQLIVNTTPLGMAPDEDHAPELPYHALTPQHLLYDLVYNPAETKFLRLGKERGAIIKNGYEMLLAQAEASWDIWQRKPVMTKL